MFEIFDEPKTTFSMCLVSNNVLNTLFRPFFLLLFKDTDKVHDFHENCSELIASTKNDIICFYYVLNACLEHIFSVQKRS